MVEALGQSGRGGEGVAREGEAGLRGGATEAAEGLHQNQAGPLQRFGNPMGGVTATKTKYGARVLEVALSGLTAEDATCPW